MKSPLKGLDTHGNNLKEYLRTEENGEVLLVAHATGGVKGQSDLQSVSQSVSKYLKNDKKST